MSGAEGAIITGTAKVVAGMLFSQSTRDFFFKWKLDTDLLDQLEVQVTIVEKLCWDAETKLIERNHIVNEWLKKARFAIYDTEDLLEKILIDVHEVNNRLHNTPIATKSFIEKLLYKGSSFMDKLAHKGKDIVRTIHPNKKLRETRMSEMIEKLKHLASQKGDLGLQDKNELVQFQVTRISTSDDTDKSKIVGRDNAVDEIVELLNVRDKLRVITITGMGGVGKTTLASMVYKRYETACPANSKEFEVIAWVCVSDSFDFEHVMKSILELITENGNPRPGSSGSDKPRPELLRQELSRALHNKKFLIVLDDVWIGILEKWETLKNIFSVGAPGSRIIVTTREENVANFVSDSCGTYTLYELSDDECWSLFQSHAFRNGDSISKYPRLETIGKKIVAKCSGLPLAVKMVGKALGMKGYDENQWNLVLNSKIWDSTSDVLPSLWLSYYHLPVEIKLCFAYFSIFPKDEVFSMENMILLWIAEGFVRIPDGTSTCSDYYESKARTYFKHLYSAFFIQPTSTSSGLDGFVMHDLVHDLAQHVSEDVLVNLNNPKPKSRRLYYIQWKDETLLNTELLQNVSGMRTFLSGKGKYSYFYDPALFDKKMFDGLLSKFKLLRVLSLEGYYALSELPDAVGDMTLLKYLNLARTNVNYLPGWICRLYSLQTLNISYCPILESLPAKLCKLVNLRHLIVTRAIQMPDGFGRMTNLQTLPNYKLLEGRSKQMREFKDLCNIRGSLEISKLNHVDNLQDVITGNFKNKKYLESYTLSWEDIRDRDTHLDESVLDALQPHMNLKELVIYFYGGKRLSNWIVGGSPDFTMIVSLDITGCFNCKTLPSLGNLPHLEHLSISRLDSLETLDAEFFGNSETAFKALERLQIRSMKSLKTWYIPQSSRGFCSLTSLCISRCSRLTEIPYCFPSLMQLSIYFCDDLFQFKMWEALTTFGHSLQSIDIRSCPMLKEIPKNFVNLVEVIISCCNSLVSMPRLRNVQKLSVHTVSSLKIVEAAIQNGVSEKLNIGSPPGKVNLDTLSPSLELGETSFSQRDADDEPVLSLLLQKLSQLSIWGNKELDYFKKIPFRLNFNTLTHLEFQNCDSFEDVVLPFTIEVIEIRYCATLTTIPDQFIAGCRFLQRFTICGCESLKYLPSILSTSSISAFQLYDLPALKALPEGFHSNTTLQDLQIHNCPNLVFPQDGLPVKLESLEISSSISMMTPVPGNTYRRSISELKLSNLTSLTSLILYEFDGTFEEDNCLPKSIKYLEISNFPDLKS